jgi:hypothetical protein
MIEKFVVVVLCEILNRRYRFLELQESQYLKRYKDLFNKMNLLRRGHDRMVVGFTTTYAISVYHH